MYYNFDTMNESFLKVHKVLKDKGIINNKFMLSLENVRLKSIDPYDSSISFIDKSDIIQECRDNIWYFLREVVRIPAPGGGGNRFRLDVSNCAQIYLAMLNCNSWITKPRQNLSTMSSLVLGDYFRLFHFDCYAKAYLCNRFDSDVKHLRCKSSMIFDLLPIYLQPCTESDDCVNIKFSTNDQDDIGRGFVYFDDGEFIPNVKEIYENLKNKLTIDNL